MRRNTIALASVAFIGVGAGTIVAQAPKAGAGKAIYDSNNCKTCHFADGKGNKLYPLDGIGTRMTDVEIRKWITSPAEMETALMTAPKVKMSAVWRKHLSDVDVDALVAYIKSLK